MADEIKFSIKDFKTIVSALEVHDKDVVIFKFDPDMDAETLQACSDTLNEVFTDNQVVGITSDIDVLIQSPKEAIDMLEKMIAKIKLLNGVTESKLIV